MKAALPIGLVRLSGGIGCMLPAAAWHFSSSCISFSPGGAKKRYSEYEIQDLRKSFVCSFLPSRAKKNIQRRQLQLPPQHRQIAQRANAGGKRTTDQSRQGLVGRRWVVWPAEARESAGECLQ